jgi:hypothetical protein
MLFLDTAADLMARKDQPPPSSDDGVPDDEKAIFGATVLMGTFVASACCRSLGAQFAARRRPPISPTCSPSTKPPLKPSVAHWMEGGELSAIAELRRHFPLITDNARARLCVRIIAGWQSAPAPNKGSHNPVRH